MLRMMHRGQILPAAGVVAPVIQAGSGDVEPGRNLPLQRIPGRKNIRRPDDGAVVLDAEIAVAGEDQGAVIGVLAESVVERCGVKQRIHVEILRARANVVVAAIRGQIGLGLIGPKRVESLAQDVVANRVPVPLRGFGIGRVDVGTGVIVGQTVGRRAVGEMLEPAVLGKLGVEAVRRHKARPDADHGLNAHLVQLVVHGLRIGPVARIEIHLAHVGVVEPVDDDRHREAGGVRDSRWPRRALRPGSSSAACTGCIRRRLWAASACRRSAAGSLRRARRCSCRR